MDFTSAFNDLINATHSGFAFLIANGIGWLAVGMTSLRLSVEKTAKVLLYIGILTMPLAFVLRSILGFADYSPENPLNELGLLLAFSPVVGLAIVIISYIKLPLYMPSLVSALLGAHLLPYSWLYQTNIYLIVGILVAIVPSILMLIFREKGFSIGPFFVGTVLIFGALALY
ncbi:hypothetical protein MG296_14535 [Flavobacteriaceae bacterium TK19130]|nr:hypothetical protein [Thermobacterium salinum]